MFSFLVLSPMHRYHPHRLHHHAATTTTDTAYISTCTVQMQMSIYIQKKHIERTFWKKRVLHICINLISLETGCYVCRLYSLHCILSFKHTLSQRSFKKARCPSGRWLEIPWCENNLSTQSTCCCSRCCRRKWEAGGAAGDGGWGCCSAVCCRR